MNIKMDYTVIPGVSTNCYLLINKDTDEAVIIDPAGNEPQISALIEKNKCRPCAILITHGHYDHIGAARQFAVKYGIKVYAGEHEKELLADAYKNLSAHMGAKITLEADVWIKDKQHINPAGIDIEVIHTPGHTSGGVSYYVKDASVLFSGDTLFAESVGRTDFATGSFSDIVSSIKDKLFLLPDDTVVFPGHGESTSIAHEKKYNPYCQ